MNSLHYSDLIYRTEINERRINNERFDCDLVLCIARIRLKKKKITV